MIIVKPYEVNDATLISSTLVEPDYLYQEEEWSGRRRFLWSTASPTSTAAMCHYDGVFFIGNGADTTKIYSFVLSGDTVLQSELFTLNVATANVVSICYDKSSDIVAILDDALTFSFYNSDGTFIESGSDSGFTPDGGIVAFGGGFIYSKYTGASSKPVYYFMRGLSLADMDFSQPFEILANGDSATSPFVYDGKLYVKTTGSAFYEVALFEDGDTGTDTGFFGSQRVFYSPYDNKSYTYFDSPIKLTITRRLPDLSAATSTYKIGDYATLASEHAVYQCAADDTLDRPDIGAAKEIPTWVRAGATNKYKMFDGTVGNQTIVDGGSLTVTLTYPQAITSVCGFNIDNCSTVEVTISGGTAYNETITMGANRSFSLFGLSGTTVTLVFTPSASPMKVGFVGCGEQKEFGDVNFGSGLGLLDFSRVENDAFGNTSITPRRRVKTIDYDVTIDTADIEEAFNFISSITTEPSIYAGVSDFTGQALVVFAIYQDFRANVEAPDVSTYTLSVQGLA